MFYGNSVVELYLVIVVNRVVVVYVRFVWFCADDLF